MIEKSRLDELIKQGATIWYVGKDYSVNANRMVEIRLGEFNKIESDCLLVKLGDGFHTPRYNFVAYLDKLFETQKQAEWSLKYQHIPRTEELNLPMWEEIEDAYVLEKDKFCLEVYKTNNKILVMTDNKYVFSEPATEENYIKACELCLKLFKGEEE